MQTAEERLKHILTPSDSLSVDSNKDLCIEGSRARDLVGQFGSPLYVLSERTLRANYRRIRDAFRANWPKPVNILYAIKANNNLAVRAILHQEGAGSDCFGQPELYATFAGGADPGTVVLNGSNKTFEDLRQGVERGVLINVDAEDEISFLAELAEGRNQPIRVNLRLKVFPEEFGQLASDFFHLGPGAIVEFLRNEKWGFSIDAAVPLLQRLMQLRTVDLVGYHLHLGRVSPDPRSYSIGAAGLAEAVKSLYRTTGFWPRILDVGGGWARERDSEGGTLARNPNTIEQYAEAACRPLREGLQSEGLPLPSLWLEPGRYIAGNAGVLLATVGSIKRDLGKTWIHIDASTNDMMRIDTNGWKFHLLPGFAMDRPDSGPAMVVGSTCIHSVFDDEVTMPDLVRGDVIAILDAGMYAETTSTQFNGVPRPATVLVNGAEADIIKERETIADIFAKHRIPERLHAGTSGV